MEEKDYFDDYMTIVQIRKKLGMTQNEFAEKFHIPISRLKKWEYVEKQTPNYALYMIRRIIDLEGGYEAFN